MPITDIKEIRLLPPLAIARLGSSPEPMDNYDVQAPDNPAEYRKLIPAETLIIENGQVRIKTPVEVRFRDNAGRIRPVCPFLEVWARFEDDGDLEPLTQQHLADLQLSPADVKWQVHVANLKAYRRTGQENDKIEADLDEFSDHAVKDLEGKSPHFKAGKSIPFGMVQYIDPTDAFPEVRLRFTPAPGKVYGPGANDPNTVDDVYDAASGDWDNHADGAPNTPPGTVPGNIYAGETNSQTRQYVSLGYLDDACDGIVDVRLTVNGNLLASYARISVGPPDFAPDSFHVRTVNDDLEQMLFGPEVKAPVEQAEVTCIVRRALETVRLMNTEVMNGNQAVGGVPTNPNNMAGQDRNFERAFEPIFPPQTVDAFAVRSFHASALQTLDSGVPPWFLDLLRKYDQVADLSDTGRRRMPAMMRGSDGAHLALTRRQVDKVRVAAAGTAADGANPEEDMLTLIAFFQSRASLHQRIDAGNNQQLSDLFLNPQDLRSAG